MNGRITIEPKISEEWDQGCTSQRKASSIAPKRRLWASVNTEVRGDEEEERKDQRNV